MKYFLTIFLFSMTGFKSYTQLYVKPSAGYCFDFIKKYNGGSGYYYYQATALDTVTIEHALNTSLGNGAKIACSLGYKIKNDINFELGISYFIGRNTLTSNTTYITPTVTSTGITKNNARFLIINPAIIYNIQLGKKIESYLRIGYITGSGRLNINSTSTSNQYPPSESFSYTSGNYISGFSAGLGLMYNLKNNLSLFGIIEFSAISYTPSYLTSKKYIYRGEDQSYRGKTYEYVDENYYTGLYDRTYNPRKVTHYYQNVSLNVGIKYNISSKDSSNKKTGIELSTGCVLIDGKTDNPTLPEKLRIFNALFVPVELNFIYKIRRFNIGIGGKSLFNTGLTKTYDSQPKIKSFHIAFLLMEFNVINREKFAIAPFIKAGIYEIFSNYWPHNAAKLKIYGEAGINCQLKFGNYDLLIKPNVSYIPKMSNMSSYYYSNSTKFFALNFGIRRWF